MLARRYGRLPSEIMKLPPYELTLNVICALHGQEAAAERIEAIRRAAAAAGSQSPLPVPVVDVGGG